MNDELAKDIWFHEIFLLANWEDYERDKLVYHTWRSVLAAHGLSGEEQLVS